MIAKVLSRDEGRVVVAFEPQTPAEGMILGLIAADQSTEAAVSVNSYPTVTPKPPEANVHIGSFALRTVEMIQGR